MASIYEMGQAAPQRSSRDPSLRRSRSGERRDGAQARDGRSIASLIEGEIIPRLMVSAPGRSIDEVALPGVGSGAVSESEVLAFVPLALQVEADELLDYVERIRTRGVSMEILCVELLAPAARVIGDWWEDDRADFFDVTMALWRLQEVVHELSVRVPPPVVGRRAWRHALLAPMPGDQHGFGTLLLEEVFVRSGWTAERLPEARVGELAERVSADWFDLAGLTVSCDCNIGALPSVIATIRSASRNPRICVMVGGPALVRDPSISALVGADGTARDARVAVAVAERLVNAVAGDALPRD